MPPDLQPPSPTSTLGSLLRKPIFLKVAAVVILVLIAGSAYFFIQQKNPPKPIISLPPADNALPPLSTRFLGCPLSESLCKSADFSTHVKDSSFSATLKENTPLLAVFDGEIDVMPISRAQPGGKNEQLTMLAIFNRQQKLVAEYYFKGSAVKKKTVKEGEIIATASGQPLNFLEGKSLVFVVLGMTKEGDSGLEPLEATHFK